MGDALTHTTGSPGDVATFAYEPVEVDGEVRDILIVEASGALEHAWPSLPGADGAMGPASGARLLEHGLVESRQDRLFRSLASPDGRPFAAFVPTVDDYLCFEPAGPRSYAVCPLSRYAGHDARAHFLRNICQMGGNTVLLEVDGRGRMEALYVSPGLARLMECGVAAALRTMDGMGLIRTSDAEDRPLVRSMLKNRVAFDGGTDLTVQLVTARRRRVWCNVHFAFIEDYGRRYIYCTYTDINTLKLYEERLRSTYANLGDSFYQVNERTLALFRVNVTNDSFEEVKGPGLFDTDSIAFSYSEAMRQRAGHFPIAGERRAFLEAFQPTSILEAYRMGRTSISQVLYSVRRDGRSCFVNFSASLTRHPLTGDIVAFITEQECNGDKVRETLMDKILGQQFDMVCYLVNGQYGVTIGSSDTARRGNVFPVTRSGNYAQYLSSQILPVLSGDEDERQAACTALSLPVVAERLREHEPYVVDIAVEVDGDTYYKQFDFYSIDPDANFYILLKSDTTQIQRQHIAMNDSLKEALGAANQANVAKTAFLSSMSHEIRTPMNAIIGLDAIALADPELSDSTRKYLGQIGDSARHLLGLINDILDMSRIESGKTVINDEEFAMDELLDQVNTIVSSQCRDKGLSYAHTAARGASGYYFGDALKIKQVIINILGNAVKFTPQGGTVTFAVEQTGRLNDQARFRLTMADTGIGMDASYLPRIFEPFSQEDSSASNRYGSTGLGLSITKNIVELMNGTIAVESEKGVGSTFTVELPLRVSERRHDAAFEAPMGELKVLVVDDDEIACEHARLVLAEAGIAADTCLSGDEAVERVKLGHARREQYDLIFVDWKMPRVDGVEATRRIREQTGPASAVIFLTAYNWDEVEDEARAAGVDGFMAKPLEGEGVRVAAAKAARLKHERGARRAELAGKRVLLAEDMVINAEIIEQLLDMRGVACDRAENGAVALDMFASQPAGYYDAVLMDLRMPVMDGLTATERIRAAGKQDSRTIPIIALTANAFDEDVQNSFRAGMNAHLSKPVEPDKLFATLEELV